MLRLRLCCLASFLYGPLCVAQDVTFDRYHSEKEINTIMTSLASANPDFVHVKRLGFSHQNRDINVLVLAKSPYQSLPGIYFNATHHGDEKSSTEALLGLMDFLTSEIENPVVQRLLDRYTLYLQPLVNPDGHARDSRFTALGKDPNRDYALPGGKRKQPFQQREIQIVKDFIERNKIRAAAALHSGMEGVLWPWGYTSDRVSEHSVFFTIAQNCARAMNIRLYKQSFYDYKTEGEFIDYVYWRYKALGFTFEVSQEATPSLALLPMVVNRFVKGAMRFMNDVLAYDEGKLEIKASFDNDYLAAQ